MRYLCFLRPPEPHKSAGALRQDTAIASADPYSGQDGLRPAGSFISSVVGVRVATPFFGTGFNACIGAPAAPLHGALGLGNGPQWHQSYRMHVRVCCPAA